MSRKKDTKLGLLGDVPVGDRYNATHTESDDGLDRHAYAKVLADSAIYTRDTLTVGMYGDWGTGKTSLMQLMKGAVDEAEETAAPKPRTRSTLVDNNYAGLASVTTPTRPQRTETRVNRDRLSLRE